MFVPSPDCNKNCACSMCYTTNENVPAYVLKNEFGVPTYRLFGYYGGFFQNSKIHKKIQSKRNLKLILQRLYKDQNGLWNKILSLESRSKNIPLRALFFRCCIEYINGEISDCEDLIDIERYQQYETKKYERKSVLNLRSGRIVM